MAAYGVGDLRQRPVERIFRQVDLAEHLAQELQADFRVNERLQLVEHVISLLLAVADERYEAGHDLQVVGFAAELGEATLERLVEALRVIEGLAGGKHD